MGKAPTAAGRRRKISRDLFSIQARAAASRAQSALLMISDNVHVVVVVDDGEAFFSGFRLKQAVLGSGVLFCSVGF